MVLLEYNPLKLLEVIDQFLFPSTRRVINHEITLQVDNIITTCKFWWFPKRCIENNQKEYRNSISLSVMKQCLIHFAYKEILVSLTNFLQQHYILLKNSKNIYLCNTSFRKCCQPALYQSFPGDYYKELKFL